jgi:cobalamin biosynthesis Mg chelatase CobN
MSLFHPDNRKNGTFPNLLNQRGRALVVLAVVLTLASCATTNTVQLDAFNGLKTIRISVLAATTVFKAGYDAGQFSEAQRTQLGELYNKYLAADTIAATTLQTTTTTDPAQIVGQVTILAGEVLKFVSSLSPPKVTP